MASNIDTTALDPTKPTEVVALTADVRANFSNIKANLNTAASEITALQTTTATVVQDQIHVAAAKVVPADSDEFGITDSAASYALKKLTWANIKAAFVSYYNGLAAILTNKTIVVANNTVTTAASGNLVATELNAALAELDGQDTTIQTTIDTHIADALGAHAGTAISYDNSGSGLVAVNVQTAIDEVEGRVDVAETAITGHIADAVDAHDASAISNIPAGDIVATDVQAALNELDTDKVPRTGLTGSATIPAGTSAQRDGSPAGGYIRYNSDEGAYEGYFPGIASWAELGGGQYLGTAAVKAIAYNAQTISENITIGATQNGLSAGPITIADTFTVTISDGGNWVIVGS